MNPVFLILVLCASLNEVQHLCFGLQVFSDEEVTNDNEVSGDKAELSCTCHDYTEKASLTMAEMEEVSSSIFTGQFCRKADCYGSEDDCYESEENVAIIGVNGDIFEGNGDMYEGNTGIFEGNEDMFRGNRDISGGREDMFSGFNECDQLEICEIFHQCHNCSVIVRACKKNALGQDDNYTCHKKKILLSNKQDIFGSKWSSTYDLLNRLRRGPRQVSTCKYPNLLQTSEIDCISHPSYVKCMQKCQFGYTLREGIERRMSCSHQENVWKPAGFEECQPFIDCNLKLKGPGNLKCVSATTMDPPTCNVTCFSNGDKKGTPNTSYTCQISGTWDKKLPHCVSTKSVINLVPAPRIKLHSKDSAVPWAPSVKKHKRS